MPRIRPFDAMDGINEPAWMYSRRVVAGGVPTQRLAQSCKQMSVLGSYFLMVQFKADREAEIAIHRKRQAWKLVSDLIWIFQEEKKTRV